MGVDGVIGVASNVISRIHLGRGWELGTLISQPAPAGRRLWRGVDAGVADTCIRLRRPRGSRGLVPLDCEVHVAGLIVAVTETVRLD